MAAVSLYDKGLRAVVGRSLRDDDRESYKALIRLFEVRNRLAHRGNDASIADEDAAEAVAASATASRYLQSLI